MMIAKSFDIEETATQAMEI